MSGSCLSILLRPLANVSPAFSFTFTWFIPFIVNSTGSSTVIIFNSFEFNSLSIEYKVVDLPLPVGPVTRIIPCGFEIILFTFFMFSSSIPRSSFLIIPLPLLRILITTFSPNTTGRTDILRSTSLSSTFIIIFPSCGILFSAILSPAIILVTKGARLSMPNLLIVLSFPSILYRILISFSNGSI